MARADISLSTDGPHFGYTPDAMTLGQLLDLSALVLGLYSAVFFAVGVWTIKDATLKKIAVSFWEPGRTIAKELTLQKADFTFGAGFLLLSFGLQFVSKVFVLSEEPVVCSRAVGVALGVGLSIVVCVASLIPWKIVRKGRMDKLERIIATQG